jgi:hypothetical protein
MKRILAKLPVLALVVSPVCSTPAAIEQREHRYGTYQLYIPETRSTESNIVVVVHGTPQPDQDAADLARRFISRWTDFADETNSIIIAPAFDQENFASCDSGMRRTGWVPRSVRPDRRSGRLPPRDPRRGRIGSPDVRAPLLPVRPLRGRAVRESVCGALTRTGYSVSC